MLLFELGEKVRGRERTKEEKRGVKLMGDCVVVLQGGTALRECILVNGWYQER